jgi:pyridoxal phosphate-dependent aminotransferase EpsN
VIAVHLYGQSADLDRIMAVCSELEVPLIEDAAESLGARYGARHPGTFGVMGLFSFNGNKVITTSGGGMLVSDDGALAARARKLATQAREPAPHYEHREIGFNYRLSNVLAAIGRAQLTVLDARVQARRANFAAYCAALGAVPGLEFQPEAPWGLHSRWLTCVIVRPDRFGADREAIRVALEQANIESRPLWKPMHLQPVFAECESIGGGVAEDLFRDGLCLPSGSNLSAIDRQRVIDIIGELHRSR